MSDVVVSGRRPADLEESREATLPLASPLQGDDDDGDADDATTNPSS